MKERSICYLIRRGNEYFQTLTGPEGETDVSKMRPVFSIYKHDAAKIPKLWQAQHIITALRPEGENWGVSKYNRLTFYEVKIS